MSARAAAKTRRACGRQTRSRHREAPAAGTLQTETAALGCAAGAAVDSVACRRAIARLARARAGITG